MELQNRVTSVQQWLMTSVIHHRSCPFAAKEPSITSSLSSIAAACLGSRCYMAPMRRFNTGAWIRFKISEKSHFSRDGVYVLETRASSNKNSNDNTCLYHHSRMGLFCILKKWCTWLADTDLEPKSKEHRGASNMSLVIHDTSWKRILPGSAIAADSQKGLFILYNCKCLGCYAV